MDLKWLLGILLLVLGLVLAYQIIRLLTGGSWNGETVILGLVLANLGYSFYLGNRWSEQKGRSERFEKQFDAHILEVKGKLEQFEKTIRP